MKFLRRSTHEGQKAQTSTHEWKTHQLNVQSHSTTNPHSDRLRHANVLSKSKTHCSCFSFNGGRSTHFGHRNISNLSLSIVQDSIAFPNPSARFKILTLAAVQLRSKRLLAKDGVAIPRTEIGSGHTHNGTGFGTKEKPHRLWNVRQATQALKCKAT